MMFNTSDVETYNSTINIMNENGELLPFICVDSNETNSYKAPEHPTDNNVIISDTLWREPKEISMSGHIYSGDWDKFRQLTSGKLGLYTVTILGGVYKNMALLNVTREETPEENTGYAVSLEFKEVIKVESKTSKMTKQQVQQAQYASTQDSGKQDPKNKKLQSTLHASIYGENK